MEGTLFATPLNDAAFELFDEIVRNGHSITISDTNFEYKSPFMRLGATEIVGAEAIRRHFGLISSEQTQG